MDLDSLLHFLLFPAMAPGHLLPMIHLAKLFASRCTRATLIVTPYSAASHGSSIARSAEAGLPIGIELLYFPSSESGLPAGRESLDQMTSREEDGKFFAALDLLEPAFRRLVEEIRPDCIISDMFYPWTADVAESFSIPRILFSGSGYFASCAIEAIAKFSPEKVVTFDTEPFSVPGLPDEIKMTKAKLPDAVSQAQFKALYIRIQEAEAKNYGWVMNSFYDLERSYIHHLQNEVGKKTWHVGPVSLYNQHKAEMLESCKRTSADSQTCLGWLDAKKPNSVLYICFGSMCKFSPAQMVETAAALEDMEVSFIWVVKNEEVLPEGFEESVAEKGVVIRGWAPQVVILGHGAVGGFVTHCGWNSLLEGLSFGLPMVTWPVFAEQFYNEKLVTEVLRVGVGVGVERWVTWEEREVVGRRRIKDAAERVMGGGEEAEEMRRRVKEVAEAAKKAVAEGGSSYLEVGRLIKGDGMGETAK